MYETICQRPGEIRCTLPGRIYYAVRNPGPHFAIAINYEYLNAVDAPENYVWCTKQKCGGAVSTLSQFKPVVRDIKLGKKAQVEATQCGKSTRLRSGDLGKVSNFGQGKMPTSKPMRKKTVTSTHEVEDS